jgi:type III restriction enzyme
MMQLKNYQERVLESLRGYFADCADCNDPAMAYRRATARVYGMAQPYNPAPDPRFARMPYVCVRVPTGGGKTLLACHTAGIAQDRFLQAPRVVVLWLVPSNTLLEQTAVALGNPRHPYHLALHEACKGPVEVLRIDEALRLKRNQVDGATVVIVSTIQCFRTSDPEGRKVYDTDNGELRELVEAIPASFHAELDPGADGKPGFSLINVLRHRRPVVIVDEAHNARTPLSFAMLATVQPACIVEFTATPDLQSTTPSNVLHRVSAAELKAEHMVKLPLRVFTRAPGQRDELLAEALRVRSDLEALALQEERAGAAHLRPILLVQAERVDACEPLRDQLVADFGVAKEAVRISTGKLDELKDVKDLSAPSCPVRVIVTVEKLREGWDCPFAYVLCSLRETHSATAIEQLVGRILRQPGAVPRAHADLNCAYAFAIAQGNHLEAVLAELRDALVRNGFTKAEAQQCVRMPAAPQLPLAVVPETVALGIGGVLAPVAADCAVELAGKVAIDAVVGNITILAPLTDEEHDRLLSCVRTVAGQHDVSAAVKSVRDNERAMGGGKPTAPRCPFEKGAPFRVPRLCVLEDGSLVEFEKSHLIDHPWRLGQRAAALPADYDPAERPGLRVGSVDVGIQGKVEVETTREPEVEDFVGRLHLQLLPMERLDHWTVDNLVPWLDKHIEHRDITPGESAVFLRNCVEGLLSARPGLDIAALALDRFRLRDRIEALIDEHRAAERQGHFQQWLLPESALTVADEYAVDFRAQLYEPSWLYEGSFLFRKHYYGSKPGELRERRADGKLTEEFQCAQHLDGLPEVEYWVRNLSRKPSSFRLQTSADFFYPDFVCRLKDGRILVVEYKGEDRFDGLDSAEKRLIGHVWESRSAGRALFVMPTDRDWSTIEAKVRTPA